MRKVTKILIIIVLSLFLCASSFAQNKIAVVDTSVFYDEKHGIMELVTANKQLEDEFKPKAEKFNDIGKELAKDITSCSKTGHCDLKELEKRITEYEKQNKEFKETFYTQFEKRRSEIVEPINRKIGDKAKEFVKKKGYAMLLDISKIDDDWFICELCQDNDVTKEFIKFCNEEFEKEKARK